MHEHLREVIQHFRAAQDLAVSTLRDRLGIPMPTSNLAWSGWAHFGSSPQQMPVYELGQRHGIFLRTHGFGIEVRFPKLTVDFDWGDCGEAYGFDLWRLWNHCRENRILLNSFTHDLMERRLEKARLAGELVADSHLFYLPEERERFGAVPADHADFFSPQGPHAN